MLPDAGVEFTFTNHGEQHFKTYPLWDIQKRVDGRWYSINEPAAAFLNDESIAPGDSKRWEITVDNSNLGRSIEPVDGNAVTVRALGGGTYAFMIAGSYSPEFGAMADDTEVAYAAQFSLAGDPLPLVPTDEVRDVSHNENSIIVRISEEPTIATTVTKRDRTADESDGDERYKFITEQLYRRPTLRDAISYADSVDRVRVEYGIDRHLNNTSPAVSLLGRSTVIYQGTQYAVVTERLTNTEMDRDE